MALDIESKAEDSKRKGAGRPRGRPFVNPQDAKKEEQETKREGEPVGIAL